MVLAIIALMSLSVIYFIRLLRQKKLYIGAIVVAILYTIMIVWVYCIFIFDVVHLGFSDAETKRRLLDGSQVYISFIRLTSSMSVLSVPILKAIAIVAFLSLAAGLTVVFHGLFAITAVVIRCAKNIQIFSSLKNTNRKSFNLTIVNSEKQLIRLLCRMNC